MRNRLILSALFCAAISGSARASADDAWLAWVGCWRPEGDASSRSLCIVPDNDGVRMITLNGSRIESESRVVANGQPRAISQEGCTGTETAVWSKDRQRVFLNTDLDCGNAVSRKVSGMFVVVAPNQWVSIQSIGTAGNQSMHIVRYVESHPTDLPAEIANAFRDNRLARETVRVAAAARLDLDDVKEAVKVVRPAVVEGWLTTVGQAFDLNAATLMELADAGVPASVIDVLVAVSNPGKFAVREERAADRDSDARRRPRNCLDYWYDPFDPFGYSYRPGYGYGCRGGWGWYPWGGGWGGYYPGTVIVVDREPRSRGKVTKEGYKSGRPRDGSTTSTPDRVSSTPSSTPAKSSGSSDTSSDSGRKAKPRGGN